MIKYFVFCRAAAWWVGFDGRYFGPYASREAAVAAAIGSAEVCVAEGAPARVMAEGRFGGFLTIWTADDALRAA